ncbi:acetaldehyde dehydrogenase (acetylating) [Persicimonas caeni]|uniref:Acetaldehyde dehydrogenase n=1 Tax=Persicimonas caeni TaxID=2292766 RepID=A0A4Y6PVU0_PERCE|nr:acetaldehyde dehydrogenase (acetylating) [Persicimonas caeni]QDG52471.1 acetaldehyde dehydrogenase (acetylating) [Persicimonas caeni]QED33693.1 acetaldehyde dehydrogenase (acetylating) [Persicimonas caeni]
MTKTHVAILGSGNIGTDLMIKILERSDALELDMLVGIDPESEGLARARKLGVATTHEGIAGLMEHECWERVEVVFDATSAKAHLHHAPILEDAGKIAVDLTPAAVGPYVVPVANLEAHQDATNVNMVTCGGQATIPIIWAINQVSPVHYGEIVASISSRSAGPGTRANIDEFTQTTSRGIEEVGGAGRGKAIIILNPADPPLIMRDTVYAFCDEADRDAIRASIEEVVARVAEYVPGYRLVKPPVFEDYLDEPLRVPGEGELHGTKVTCFLEVEGAGDYLPKCAGNLDIMTSAALRMGELLATQRKNKKAKE